MNDGNTTARQQIVEKIKDSSNILVTVGTDPSVDELSAALGLTIMLNTLGKHATAVVSGKIPPAIDFLEPGKTFENTVDSLRDFIIALDKEKADHLRYKVEGDVVKIFITPYRTTITEDNLDFSQGDYNVELVLALGVESEEHLDKALESHGRILHDATVATLSDHAASKLGSIDWYDEKASSISEMLVSLSEAVKTDKPVLDEQTSTAFLTGIVAATDRFSNEKTSSKVMTMAAQLMAAGANQQLIAAKLQDAHEISSDNNDTSEDDQPNNDGTTDLSEGESTKLNAKKSKTKKAKEESAPKPDDGTLAISHEPEGTLDQVAREVRQEQGEQATEKAEDALAEQLGSVAPATATTSVADLQSDLAAASADVDEADAALTKSSDPQMPGFEPMLGGTLNATTEQAADDSRQQEESNRNKTILTHGSSSGLPISDGPTFPATPFNASSVGDDTSAREPAKQSSGSLSTLPPLPSFESASPVGPTLADLDQANRAPAEPPHTDALAAVHAVFDDSTDSAASSAMPSLPPLPDAASVAGPSTQPSATGLPPLPDFSTLPPLPVAPNGQAPASPFSSPSSEQSDSNEQLGQIFTGEPAAVPAPQPNDPGQFKIPGQS